MKEIIVAAWDDLLIRNGGEKVRATETDHFSLNGRSYEIDLTEENHRNFLKDLAPYIEAAHKPEVVDGQRAAADAVPRTISPENRRYYAEVREFAREFGLNFKTPAGSYYYGKPLLDAYEAYQAGAPEAEWRPLYERGTGREGKGGQ